MALTERGGEVVEAARALGPRLAAMAEDIDKGGTFPADLLDELTAAGLFHTYLPQAVGGPEVHPRNAFLASEQLAQRSGSVAWCCAISRGARTPKSVR